MDLEHCLSGYTLMKIVASGVVKETSPSIGMWWLFGNSSFKANGTGPNRGIVRYTGLIDISWWARWPHYKSQDRLSHDNSLFTLYGYRKSSCVGVTPAGSV